MDRLMGNRNLIPPWTIFTLFHVNHLTQVMGECQIRKKKICAPMIVNLKRLK